MGTWGKHSFENDWALDWLSDLNENAGIAVVEAALQRAIQHGSTKYRRASLIQRLLGRKSDTDWLTARDSARAVAAAEAVASLKGNPARDLPDQLRKWSTVHRAEFRPEMVTAALSALKIILTGSELRDLHDGREPNEWILSVRDLQQRLAVAHQ